MAVRLFAMTCGWLTMPYAFFLQGEDGWLAVPVSCYLVVNPRGTALFDTGLETALQTGDHARHGEVLGSLEPFVRPTFRPGENVAERLRAHGIDPNRIDYLVNSHLHIDHCGANRLVPNAQLVLQRREWEAATTPEAIELNFYRPGLYDLGHRRTLVHGEHDLFGDGSVVLVPTFGHTPGHQSMRVELADGPVLLSADACYMRASLERMMLPDLAVVRDADAMRASYQTIRRMQADGILVVFGHDPDQWPHLTDGPLTEVTAATVRNAARVARTPEPVAA